MKIKSMIGGLALSLVMACVVQAQPAEQAPDLAAELKQQYEALAEDDAAGRMALAEWCMQNQLTWEAARLYSQALLIAPDDQHAYDQVVQITSAGPIPEDQQLRAKLAEEYPTMKLHATNHYLIVYSADENMTRNLAALLEKAHDTFFENFRRVDYKPIPLTQRLVCLYFGTHREFIEQDERDGGGSAWAAGYFYSKTNRINFYDAQTGPEVQRLRDDIKQYEDEAQKLSDEIRQANRAGDRSKAGDLQREIQYNTTNLTRARSWLSNYAQYGNVSTTIHEATHQLAYNTGIQRLGRNYPFWIAEGIAMNFETDDFTKPFGPFQEHPDKGDAIEMVAEGKTIPLEQQIMFDEAPSDEGLRDRLYNQSWALFNFLIRHRRDQLKVYLTNMAAVQEYIRDPQIFRQQFVEAFGEPAALEPDFQKFLKQLR